MVAHLLHGGFGDSFQSGGSRKINKVCGHHKCSVGSYLCIKFRVAEVNYHIQIVVCLKIGSIN